MNEEEFKYVILGSNLESTKAFMWDPFYICNTEGDALDCLLAFGRSNFPDLSDDDIRKQKITKHSWQVYKGPDYNYKSAIKCFDYKLRITEGIFVEAVPMYVWRKEERQDEKDSR